MTEGGGVAAERARIDGRHRADADLLVGVRVPATSANLGPGYDSFGVAVDVPLVAVAGRPADRRVIARGLGAEELPDGDDNLVWQGVLAWCAHAGTEPPDVTVHVDSAIPLQRGMGSSSAAAVAGLVLGRALTGGTATVEQLLGLATALEGHPDNAAAAIAGGLVVCTPDGRLARVTPSPALRPVLIIPHQRQATGEARAVLPAEVALHLAAGNGARAAATFAGLAGLLPLDARDVVDQLHEPARLPLMPLSQAVVSALRADGVACALSGSGPTVLAIIASRDADALDRLHHLIADAVDGDAVEVLPAGWDLSGALTCPPAAAAGASDG